MIELISRYRWLLFAVSFAGSGQAICQVKTDSLFGKLEPIDISIRVSMKEFKKTKNDSSFQNHELYYRNESGTYDSLKVKMKIRGNFRYRTCYYPPIWIKIQKKQAKGTPFEGNKSLKLVLPCKNQRGNSHIVRELICYKLFEKISPFAFHTRLANIEFVEKNGKKETWMNQLNILLIQ